MVRRKSRMIRFGDRKIPLIEKELHEVSSDDVTAAIAKSGAVVIRAPRWAAAKRDAEKRGKAVMKKLGMI